MGELMSTSVGTAPQPTQKWKRGPLESVLPVAVMFTAMACFMLPLWYLFVASSKNRGGGIVKTCGSACHATC
jgi:alpha-glucosidase (family GH31 glycosyl hydrolase)